MTWLGSLSRVLLNRLLGNSGDLFRAAQSLKFNKGLRHKAIIDPVLQGTRHKWKHATSVIADSFNFGSSHLIFEKKRG